jgi:hypothetical protein
VKLHLDRNFRQNFLFTYFGQIPVCIKTTDSNLSD